MIALLRKEPAEAARLFQRALELDSQALRVHYPLAQALRGQYQAALIDDLDRLLNQSPLRVDGVYFKKLGH